MVAARHEGDVCIRSGVRLLNEEPPFRGRPRPRRHQTEAEERVRKVTVGLHLRGMSPVADELTHGCVRIEPLDQPVEQA